MYIKNRRNSNKFKGFSSYQTLSLNESLVISIAYFSYTRPLSVIKKNGKCELR